MSTVPAAVGSTAVFRHVTHAWRKAGAIVLLLAAVFLLCAPSSGSLLAVWSDTLRTTYTHGYVIAILVCWMVLRQRDRVAAIPSEPSIVASLLVAVAGLAWIVSVRAGIEIFHQLLLLGMMWLSVWAVFGARIALALWLPIGFFLFAIPIWDYINTALQEATVLVVAFLLDVTSVPAYVEGSYVHLAAGVFEIAGGCSGLHFLIVSLALSTLYGEVGRDSLKVRLQFVALAAGLALLTNWVRVYIIIVAGQLTDMQHYLIRKEHYTFGWVVFAVSMAVFFLLARRFAPTPRQDFVAIASTRGRVSYATTAIAMICVIAPPAWQFLQPAESATLVAGNTLLPLAPVGWSKVALVQPSSWNPVFIGADRVERAEYSSPAGLRVQMYIASYEVQRQDKELIAYGNSFFSPKEGVMVSESRAASGAGAREIVVQDAHGRSVIRYHYDIGGRRIERGVFAQLWYGLRAMRGPVVSSAFAVRTACSSDCDQARALLDDFVATTDSRE